MRIAGPYWLASRSPRRRLMLDEARVPIVVQPADVDDGRLAPGRVQPEAWVMALAYLKARRVVELLDRRDEPARGGTIIGADTVCVHDGAILGQPRDAEHAREMIRMMRDRTHITITGVALVTLHDSAASRTVSRMAPQRLLFFDCTSVTVGHVPDDEIDRYIAGGEWRGKAGAYNLSERAGAGWPIRVEGDPATVMGLPMQRLLRMLNHPAERAT